MFLNWTKEINAKRIVVETFFHDQNAIRFYKRHGFDDFYTVLKIDKD